MNNYFQQRIAKINLTLSEMVGGYYRMVRCLDLPTGFRKFSDMVGALL